MPLTHCIECDHQISDSARKCPSPACQTNFPLGVECELCGEVLRCSAAARSKRWVPTGYSDNELRDIFAHKDCLKRYYTPPATLRCVDCGQQVASSDLGFTALKLWSASNFASHPFTCSRCGRVDALGSAQCQEVCTRPLYLFQVSADGQGHGHAENKREIEVKRRIVEHQRVEAEKERARHEEFRKQNIGEWLYLGVVNGGLLGLVVGFFRACSVQDFSVDRGTLIVTILLFGGIGALIGLAVGYAIES